MTRIHLVQFFYYPAYFEGGVNYFEEPLFLNNSSHIGFFRQIDKVKSLLHTFSSSSFDFLYSRLSAFFEFSSERNADFLAFPEYSIPVDLLPLIKDLSCKNGICVIAGTHLVSPSRASSEIYNSVGIHGAVPGAAISPVFFPNGDIDFSYKQAKSKFEKELHTVADNAKLFTYKNIDFCVVPCIDALKPQILGKVWSEEKQPKIVFCPSFSPTVEPFNIVSNLSYLNSCVFAYANSSLFGGTSYNLPESWNFAIESNYKLNSISSNTEAILELNIDLNRLFESRGTTISSPSNIALNYFPICYTEINCPKGLAELHIAVSDALFCDVPDIDKALEHIDEFLALGDFKSNESNKILKSFRYGSLLTFSGPKESLKNIFSTLSMPKDLEPLRFDFKRIQDALSTLNSIFSDPENECDTSLFDCILRLKEAQQIIPFDVRREKREDSIKHDKYITTDKELIGTPIEAFQNRGRELDTLRDQVANTNSRVIIISGPSGIGKSEFISAALKKVISDWEPIHISVPFGGSTESLLAEISYKLEYFSDIDSLRNLNNKGFSKAAKNILKVFFSREKRLLIIDDVSDILRKASFRDISRFISIINEAASQNEIKGGRIVVVCSTWLPENQLRSAGVVQLHLKRLKDVHIRRTIEYHMRRLGLVRDEGLPQPSQQLLDILDGHALSARLLVIALKENELSLDDIEDKLGLEKITGFIASKLLMNIKFNEQKQQRLQKLSFIRIPFLADVIYKTDGYDVSGDFVKECIKEGIMTYDGEKYRMHRALSKFFVLSVDRIEKIEEYHKLAAKYYQIIIAKAGGRFEDNPQYTGELIYHYASAGETEKIKLLGANIIYTIYEVGRKSYKNGDYLKAATLFNLTYDINRYDEENIAYQARCFARDKMWEDSDAKFNEAITVASKRKRPIWWIYRDWGHIRARYDFFEEALEHLRMAESECLYEDPSTIVSLANLEWKRGNSSEARDLFEKVLTINPHHEYTLFTYIKFLRQAGDYNYAEQLRKKLDMIEEGEVVPKKSDFELEIEFDD